MKSNNDLIPIKDMLYSCLSKWKWFVISIAISLFAASMYIYLTPPTYVRSISFLLKGTQNEQPKDEKNSGIEIAQSGTTRSDELIVIQSPLIMEKVVKDLNLETEYTIRSNFKSSILYGKSLPIQVCFLDSTTVANVSMELKMLDNKKVEISEFSKDGMELEDSKPVIVSLMTPVNTPIGNIALIPNPKSNSNHIDDVIYVTRHTIQSTANNFIQHLSIEAENEKSGLIQLSIDDISQQRAEDILTTLIKEYDANWLKEQKERSINTSSFINKRLNVIEKDLGEIESDMSTYKSSNLITNIENNSENYVNNSQNIATSIQNLKTQQSILRYAKHCLTNELTKYKLIPATGLENSAVETQLTRYNSLIAQRDKLIANGVQHPQIPEVTQALNALRPVILGSIDNIYASISLQLDELEDDRGLLTNRIRSTPEQAKYLLAIERQQKVKEQIYLFLLQHLEENELNGIDILSNVKIISPVSGSSVPVTPLKNKCLLLAFALGLFVPVVIIFIIEISYNKISNRKDIESLSVPFIGEIPLADEKSRFFHKRNHTRDNSIIVHENSSDFINEAFRIVRTNLSSILEKKNNSKIIMLTSYQVNSGKTFTTLNLAMSFAIQNKNVLIIDLDLRKASASKYVNSPHTGISNFLDGTIGSPNDIIISKKLHHNLDIIPVGIKPQNPTELLSNNKLEQLLNSLRAQYDYILIDCPPLNFVADSHIINKFVDTTIFVIRPGQLEKDDLSGLEEDYKERNQSGLAILLNGVDTPKEYRNRYGKYSYHN